ncbi:MAG: hypothetical protein H6765_09295 [Candidatus Peribacteria bacterium]|nr:MAG: hypothetical protein H6765_09295 [Candidatus Peribacteria bacterium]
MDYVAVDIKHALNQYDKACGVQLQSDYWDNYHRLLALLQTGVVPYEYRTTVIK